jgi:Xaa-Pro aminopeptidase
MDHTQYQQALHRTLAGSECPFPAEEFERRTQAVTRMMEAAELDALLVTDPSDINYLTGYGTFEVSVHTALVFTAARTVLQVPSIEVGPAVSSARVDEIIGYRWEGVGDVIEPLAEALRRAGPRIGVDAWHGSLRYGVTDAVARRLPGCRFIDASGLLDGLRIVKSQRELDCLRQSARITGQGIEAAAAAVRPGVTDSDIAAVGAQTMLAAGSEFMSMQPIVVAGRRISIIHSNHRRHEIRDGEPVFLEFGSAWQRYTAPMMYTVIAGRASAEMRSVFDTCRAMYDAILDRARPGNSFDDAARAAEAAIGPLADRAFFSGVFGYTVGAQFPPSWVEGSGFIARGEMQPFQPGMVFHLPLCLRIPGQWGIGCSDTILITENGAEPLTDNPWTLPERA